jgi:ABC-type Fe3+-hydroxamate transport system substrate-binding protein
MNKSITALAATALLATVGFATAQSTDTTTTSTAATVPQTVTVTATDTSTQVIPAPPTGVVDLARPKGTVAPVPAQANGPMGMENTVMTTGVTNGATRPDIGDHASPPIQGAPTVLAVTTERTTTTTTTPVAEPAPVAAPEPVAAPMPEAAPEPMPAPRADRN